MKVIPQEITRRKKWANSLIRLGLGGIPIGAVGFVVALQLLDHPTKDNVLAGSVLFLALALYAVVAGVALLIACRHDLSVHKRSLIEGTGEGTGSRRSR